MANFNSAETMTLQDFVEAAALYPRSKEMFDLIKESSQLELMTMCLDNSEFVTEGYDLSAEVIDDLAVLTESTGEFTEAGELKERISNLGKKAWGGITKALGAALNAIVAAWKSVVKFFTGRHKEIDGKEGLPAPKHGFTIDEALNKVNGLNDEDRARCYHSLNQFMTTPLINDGKRHGVNTNDKFGYFGTTGDNSIFRKSNKLLDTLYAAAKKKDPNLQAPQEAHRKILASAFRVVTDKTNNIIQIPKFTDDVFGLIPQIASAIELMKSAEGDENAKAALRKANSAIKTITSRLKRIYSADDTPTVDKLPHVTVKKTREQIDKLNKDLTEARDGIYKSVPGGFYGQGDAEYTKLATALNTTLIEFNRIFVVYSGVAIQALSDCISTISFIDKSNAKLMQIFDQYSKTK